MTAACRKPNCTVAQTGICLLNNTADTCPERLLSVADIDTPNSSDLAVLPPLSPPTRNPQFPSSLTLTPDALREACAGRFYRLVGILGAPDAGKTAILVSLYLLLSRGSLNGFRYADSLSLLAFDEVSRGARRWNQGAPPEQMTNHTEPPDHRTAGFLHLRLRNTKSDLTRDVLLPDLPGEWSNSFIDSNRTDRLLFLKAADVIWLMVDGRELIQLKTRQQVLHRTGLLLQRISEFFGATVPPVFIVISHKDLGDPPEASIKKLETEALRFHVPAKIMQVSSFSDSDNIAPGTGIAELVEATLNPSVVASEMPLWPDVNTGAPSRQFLKFGAERRGS